MESVGGLGSGVQNSILAEEGSAPWEMPYSAKIEFCTPDPSRRARFPFSAQSIMSLRDTRDDENCSRLVSDEGGGSCPV